MPKIALIEIYLFIYSCDGSSLLYRVFSLVVVSRNYSSLECTGFSSSGSQALELRGMVVFPDQGSNLYLLHCQADSLPLSHQENLRNFFFYICLFIWLH